MFVLLALFTSAWGPITHYQFACSELAPGQSLQDCVAAHPDMISGDDFPDAFYFARDVEGSNCSGFAAFHDNAFATQMLLTARTYTPPVAAANAAGAAPTTTRLFNASAFATGFASHMYADDVGFYRSTIAPASTYLNWLRAWTVSAAGQL